MHFSFPHNATPRPCRRALLTWPAALLSWRAPTRPPGEEAHLPAFVHHTVYASSTVYASGISTSATSAPFPVSPGSRRQQLEESRELTEQQREDIDQLR